jgi:hypothetical protein
LSGHIPSSTRSDAYCSTVNRGNATTALPAVFTTNGSDSSAFVIASPAGLVWPGLTPITGNTDVLAIVCHAGRHLPGQHRPERQRRAHQASRGLAGTSGAAPGASTVDAGNAGGLGAATAGASRRSAIIGECAVAPPSAALTAPLGRRASSWEEVDRPREASPTSLGGGRSTT